jgi:hypothetical protein
MNLNPAASWVTPKASRKSSTARFFSFLTLCRKLERLAPWHQAGGSKVVDVQSLLQELLIRIGNVVLEHLVGDRLQGE